MVKIYGIEAWVREEYGNPGRVYACYFQIRHGFNGQCVTPLQRNIIPICSREKVKDFVSKQAKSLADIWNLNPPKKGRKKNA